MADFRVIAPLASKILDATNAWSGIAGKLSSLVMAPILTAVTILIMWHGFNIVRGAGGNNHILDVFSKFLRAFLVVGLALSGGAYASNILGFFHDLRDGLTTMFVAGSASSYDALDNAVKQALSSWDPTWAWASEHTHLWSGDISGLVAVACWFFMAGAMLILAIICAINLIVIDFALALIFALGPIFIACFAFQSTARFTDAWLGSVLKYTFTAVVIAAVVGIATNILQTYAKALASSAGALDFVTAAFGAVGASLILIVLTGRIPQIAGDIVGGIGISAFGPAIASAPLAAMASATRSGASGAANAVAYGAGRAAQTGVGQAIGQVGSSIAQSSLGAKVAGAYKSAAASTRGFTDAVRGRGTDADGRVTTGQGMGNAYGIGRSAAAPASTADTAGIGTVTGSRPVGRQHTPASSSTP
ncbi:type IV secretion system protein [Variovorax ginsengisoli]|uniref:Type IV secretion system protein VirB6 n=1 Tax=Variovorax ginsengisoli TaxID=363844 RepID=A0ABT9SDH9_9BURK|nr:type IV secretion system protein [Variovorax ginsengisoli]MDP9902411.1 type IV secretion system protein VirB6 [Variovorax ginsengisoli]